MEESAACCLTLYMKMTAEHTCANSAQLKVSVKDISHMHDAKLEEVYLSLPILFLLKRYFFHFLEEVTSCGKLKVIPSLEPLFTRNLDVLEVIEGRNARFDCKVSGTPPPKVTWSHFGRNILILL